MIEQLIANNSEFYSQYPVFDGIEGIWRYSKFDPSVSIWLREGHCSTVEYRQISPNTIWELGLRGSVRSLEHQYRESK